jgi:hypothetical protein
MKTRKHETPHLHMLTKEQKIKSKYLCVLACISKFLLLVLISEHAKMESSCVFTSTALISIAGLPSVRLSEGVLLD